MQLPALLSAFLLAVANAAPNDDLKVSTSVASTQTCVSKLRAVPSSVSPLPTHTKTKKRTVSSTITTCGSASTTTITITPDAVTSTTFVNTTSILQQVKPRQVTSAGTAAAAACSATSTVTTGTTTVFTGSYNGTIAKRTASPLDRLLPIGQRRSSFHANIFNVFGQRAMTGVNQKPVAIDCLKQVTTYLLTTTIIAEQPATETVTADTPTVFVTQANMVVATPTAPVPITSTTFAPDVTDTPAASGVCTVTEASSTTTQHLKCAPTNLISSVNGKGIGQTGGNAGNTRGIAPGGDPSACCQLCVDDDECAASQDDPDAENCFLWYTTPSCGEGFSYSDGGQDLKPGAGFLVQTGCGTIASEPYP